MSEPTKEEIRRKMYELAIKYVKSKHIPKDIKERSKNNKVQPPVMFTRIPPCELITGGGLKNSLP